MESPNIISTPNLTSWAQVAKRCRPGHQNIQECSANKVHNTNTQVAKESETDQEECWQKKDMNGKVTKYCVPVYNRFNILTEGVDSTDGATNKNKTNFSCADCESSFSTKSMLTTRMKIHKN